MNSRDQLSKIKTDITTTRKPFLDLLMNINQEQYSEAMLNFDMIVKSMKQISETSDELKDSCWKPTSTRYDQRIDQYLINEIPSKDVESLFYVSYPPEKCQMNAEVDQYGRTLTNGPEQAGRIIEERKQWSKSLLQLFDHKK